MQDYRINNYKKCCQFFVYIVLLNCYVVVINKIKKKKTYNVCAFNHLTHSIISWPNKSLIDRYRIFNYKTVVDGLVVIRLQTNRWGTYNIEECLNSYRYNSSLMTLIPNSIEFIYTTSEKYNVSRTCFKFWFFAMGVGEVSSFQSPYEHEYNEHIMRGVIVSIIGM